MEDMIFNLLMEKAKNKFPNSSIIPLYHKTWRDCFRHIHDDIFNMYQLYYFVDDSDDTHCECLDFNKA